MRTPPYSFKDLNDLLTMASCLVSEDTVTGLVVFMLLQVTACLAGQVGLKQHWSDSFNVVAVEYILKNNAKKDILFKEKIPWRGRCQRII